VNPRIIIQMSRIQWEGLRGHLLPRGSTREEGAFILANFSSAAGQELFTAVEVMPLAAEDFACQHGDYLELSDEARARVIKRAHDTGTCLIEAHSHLGKYPACFSPSDWRGLQEFVPHVRWRLKGKPYGAIVVTASGFDGFAWTGKSALPELINALSLEGDGQIATGLSRRYLKEAANEAI